MGRGVPRLPGRVLPDLAGHLRRLTLPAPALVLVAIAQASALVAWARWGLVERSMRRRAPMPPIGFGALLVLTIAGISAILLVAWL